MPGYQFAYKTRKRSTKNSKLFCHPPPKRPRMFKRLQNKNTKYEQCVMIRSNWAYVHARLL